MADKNKDSGKDVKGKGIPKVIELNPNNVVKTLEELLVMAKAGKIDCFVFAGFTPEDLIVSSKTDIDLISQQHLVSYLQTETVIRTMSETFVLTMDQYLGSDDDNNDDK